ncbi:hypothetical protein PC129_g21241 [Phytophthora cactorum]|uniref:Uncharacterized protein n=1 Tax=Phytophthora cactorum TaxID=29920 RepID=A0A8T1H6D9_9STRA|nr:hypothetical protein PC129_g21241 [Phytophthora cactorum]
MDLAVLYERILALVPVDDLHDSYNGVLHEELSSINRAVNDVSAAFAKLEEVHEAVNKLSNGSTGTRSVTLTEAMNSTMQLQRELKKKLESTIATMTKFCGKRKRAEKNANRNGPKAAKAEIKSEDLVRVTRHEEKKTNGEEAEPKTEDDFEMSSVADDDAVICGRKKQLFVWSSCAGHPGDFAAYDCFSKDMAAVINQGPQNGGTVALRRLNDSLLALLRDQKDSRDSQTKTNGGSHLPFDLLVWRVNAMAATDRRKHLQQVVDSLKQAMSRDASGRKEVRDLIKSLKTARQWPVRRQQTELRGLYGELAEQIQSCVDSAVDFFTKAELYSEMLKFKIKARTASSESIQVKADRLLEKVKHLKGGDTKNKIDNCILQFVEVSRHREKNWQLRTNPIVSECYWSAWKRYWKGRLGASAILC